MSTTTGPKDSQFVRLKKCDVTLEYIPEIEGYRGMGNATPLWKINSHSEAA